MLQWKSNKYDILCVFVAFGIQHAMHMRHIAIWGLSGSTKFSHIISLTVWFAKKKKKLLKTKKEYKFSIQIKF